MAVGGFLEAMPEDTEVERIERWEDQGLFVAYAAHWQAVAIELNWKSEEVEQWLFHGTDAVDSVLDRSLRAIVRWRLQQRSPILLMLATPHFRSPALGMTMG